MKNTARTENAPAVTETEAVPAAQDNAPDEGTLQYVMYVGTNDKDTYKPEHTGEEAIQIVDRICLNYFEGYTLQEATGSWKDEKDNITHEYTIVCYFDGADKEDVYHAADDIIAALNQNTVLIEENHIKMDYYSSPGAAAVSGTKEIPSGQGYEEAQPVDIRENARVSYLGPAGTYTEEAAKLFFSTGAELFPQGTVDDAIAELDSGNTDYAVIPQENTIGGAVTNYMDALIAQEDVYIVGEIVLPISQTLMGLPGTELTDIKTVYSHAQGIAQSKEWRSRNLPDAQAVEKDSTAAAASFVADSGDRSLAAIAAPGAAGIYGLEVLAENVQITMENKTRFYVLSKEPPGALHTNAVFVARCSADLIDDIIVDIHDSGLEMTALHDRPEGSFLGSYNYIIETQSEHAVTEEQISAACSRPEVRFIGCFNVTEKQ
ncbi:MAG: hypothetical protein K6C13_14895 [Oscillospiraceae bacterium]|nr:hypothetical protein [Oscillospiraceae bacterium]